MNSPAPVAEHTLPTRAGTEGWGSVFLFFLGALLCLSCVITTFGSSSVVIGAAAWTALHLATRRASSRAVRWTAASLSAVLHLGALYVTFLFTLVLGWSIPAWGFALIAVSFGVAAASGIRAWDGQRVPMLFALGVLSTVTLSGWWREGGRVWCDDLHRLQAQAGVEIVVPSLAELRVCSPGTWLPLGRYPRQIWEASDGATIVFTTQMEPYAGDNKDGFAGAVCSAHLSPNGALRCTGAGKGGGVLEVVRHNQLIATSSSVTDGEFGSAIYVLPLHDLFAEPEVVPLRRSGGAIYEPSLDVVYVIGHDGQIITPLRGADLDAAPAVHVEPILTDYGRYNEKTHEGILCGAAGPIGALHNGGRSYLATRFRGVPLGLHVVGDALLGWLAFSFGCDWDPATRKIYVAIANLGAIAELDYDSGQIVRLDSTSFGLRFLRHDSAGQRIYAGDFLRGYVVELDAASKRELRRWFVGHFARDIRITRDLRALLVATNLGIVRILL